MNCPTCGHDNPADSKFCLECGTRLATRCPSCGVHLPRTAKFCNQCGSARWAPPASAAAPAAVAPPGDRAEVRKVVTIVFADLIGSTALHGRCPRLREASRRGVQLWGLERRVW